MIHTATREFDLGDGRHCFAYGEVRYTFTVAPLRNATTWANATGGFHPAEAPTVEITDIEYRVHPIKTWRVADGTFGDFLSEVPDQWFLDQIEENAE